MYDLWHGTVESLDGSLQLLQIVDYLWSWARDIYRRQIRHSLCALAPIIREISPSTDDSFSRSQSILSELRSTSLRAPQVDVIMEDDQPTDNFTPQTGLSAIPNSDLRLLQYGPNWPNEGQCGYPQTALRHSDLIVFSFRLFRCPTPAQSLPNRLTGSGYRIIMTHFESLLRSGSIVLLKYGQVRDLERLWTTSEANPPLPAAVLDERKAAYFHFHTFCRRNDWQIFRELNCVLWDLTDVQRYTAAVQQEAFSPPYNMTEESGLHATLVELLSMVRDVSGKASVLDALKNTRSVLSKVPASAEDLSPIRWVAGCSSHMEPFEKSASRWHWPAHFYHESAQTVALRQKPSEREDGLGVVPVFKDCGQVGGLLAKRRQSWPTQCPRFCLFVMLDIKASEKSQLKQLLLSVIQEKEIYGIKTERSEQAEVLKDDRRLIRKWLESLEG